AVGPGEIVQPGHWGALEPGLQHAPGAERARIPADQLAAAIAGDHVTPGNADAPALPVVRHLVQQLERARVPAQGDPVLPGQLPDVGTDPADALTEQRVVE